MFRNEGNLFENHRSYSRYSSPTVAITEIVTKTISAYSRFENLNGVLKCFLYRIKNARIPADRL